MKVRTIIYIVACAGLMGFVFLIIPSFLNSNRSNLNTEKNVSVFQQVKDAIGKSDLLSSFAISEPTSSAVSSTVYRWQGKHGQWHFSDTPPENTEAQSEALPELVNVLPAQKTPASNQSSSRSSSVVPSTLNPANIPKLIEQAKDVKALMEQRNQQIDEAVK